MEKRDMRVSKKKEYLLDSFHNRVEAIVNRNSINRITLQSVTNANKKRACSIVRLCLDDKCIHPFRFYFQLIEHSIRTRNSSKIIRLPMIRTEYARKVSLSQVHSPVQKSTICCHWNLVKWQQLIV